MSPLRELAVKENVKISVCDALERPKKVAISPLLTLLVFTVTLPLTIRSMVAPTI
jgi:hypothetical protein